MEFPLIAILVCGCLSRNQSPEELSIPLETSFLFFVKVLVKIPHSAAVFDLQSPVAIQPSASDKLNSSDKDEMFKVDVAKDEGGAAALPRRRPSLLYLPTIICLFCKRMKTKTKRLREENCVLLSEIRNLNCSAV